MSTATSEHEILPSPYHLIKKLGSGSFGNVYLVLNKNNNSQCVIKQLHPISNQPSFVNHARRLFRQEAEILKKLTHPQIPHLIDYFEQGEDFFLVEEYIPGHTLRQEINPPQVWSETRVMELLKDGLSILTHIHEQGIIHRDIKPDNFIRRNTDQKLVLIDFGAVKSFKYEQTHLYNPTVALGTRGYMPTEQARGKPRQNSDIYALGVIAIQALTGISPLNFEEDQDGELIWQCDRINPDFQRILVQMTRYHYKYRYQSAKEVIKDLETYQQKNTQILSPPVKTTTIITSSPNLTETIKPITEEKIEKSSHKIGDWLKSPLGSTVTTAVTISLVATGGAYYMKIHEKNKQKQAEENLVTELATKYDNQAYQECFETIEAKQSENDRAITPSALEYIGKCRLAEANKQGDLSNYASALEIITKIPKTDSLYQEAKMRMDSWSQTVYSKAENLYKEEGKLEEALKEIDTLPEGDMRQAALINAGKWKEEYETNRNLLTQAEKDVEYGNCVEAIATVQQIQAPNYALFEGKKIVDKAKKCLEEQQKQGQIPANTTSQPTNNKNYPPPENNSPIIDICDDPNNILCNPSSP